MFFHLLIQLCLSESFEHTTVYGNTESLGYYYVDIWVGTPLVKQTVILDTGSHLTAFPCNGCENCGTHMDAYFNYENSSTSHVIGCNEGVKCSSCKNNQCGYMQAYSEGSSISGILIKDLMVFGDNNKSQPVEGVFGCHRKETSLFKTQRADGIMGLDWRSDNISSMVDVLFRNNLTKADIFALCFAREDGVMTIGGYNTSIHLEEIQWAKLHESRFYSIKIHQINIGSNTFQLNSNDFHSGVSATIIDSGTTFSYLSRAIYEKLFEVLEEVCKDSNKCIGEQKKVYGEPHSCWEKNDGENITEFYSTFPVIGFVVENTTIEWLPEYYLFAWPELPKVFCVGVYNNGNGMNILGGNFMRGMDVIFNRTHGSIGFAHANCSMGIERNRFRSAIDQYQESAIIHFRSFPIVQVVIISCAVMAIVMTGILYVCRKKNVLIENEIIEI